MNPVDRMSIIVNLHCPACFPLWWPGAFSMAKGTVVMATTNAMHAQMVFHAYRIFSCCQGSIAIGPSTLMQYIPWQLFCTSHSKWSGISMKCFFGSQRKWMLHILEWISFIKAMYYWPAHSGGGGGGGGLEGWGGGEGGLDRWGCAVMLEGVLRDNVSIQLHDTVVYNLVTYSYSMKGQRVSKISSTIFWWSTMKVHTCMQVAFMGFVYCDTCDCSQIPAPACWSTIWWGRRGKC